MPAGVYTFADLQVNLSMATGRRLRTALDVRSGSYFDGTRTRVQLLPTWNLSAHVEIGGHYSYSRIRFPDRGEGADIHQGRLQIRTAVDASLSGNAFLQYNSSLDRVDLNVRVRYNVAEGTDLWLVFNQGVNTDLDPDTGVGRIPRTETRSLIIKYSHTLVR